MKGRVDEPIVHGCGEGAREAHVAVGTHEREGDAVVGVDDLPPPPPETIGPTVQQVVALVCGEFVHHAVELEPGSADAVGKAPDGDAEVGVSGVVGASLVIVEAKGDVVDVAVAVGGSNHLDCRAEIDQFDLDPGCRPEGETSQRHGRTLRRA